MATATKHGSEFILQTTNQSLATRLWRYALGDTLFYPPGIGQVGLVPPPAVTAAGRARWCRLDWRAGCAAQRWPLHRTTSPHPPALQAEQVGPYTGSTGPCLVRFRDSQLTTAQLNSWILSGCSSSAAIVRVYWLGGSPGTATSREDLLTQLAAAGAPPGPVRLQVFPRRHEAALVDALPAGWQLQPVGPEWVLNVLQLSGVEGEAGAAGQPAAAPPERQRQAAAAADPQQPAEQQQQQQPAFLWSLQARWVGGWAGGRVGGWVGGTMRGKGCTARGGEGEGRGNGGRQGGKGRGGGQWWAPREGQEGGIWWRPGAGDWGAAQGRRGGVACHLTAPCTHAPHPCLPPPPPSSPCAGGWTHVLARHAQHVIAVDPAAMDPRALASGRVTHLACKAEDAVERIQELAGDSGVGLLVAGALRPRALAAPWCQPEQGSLQSPCFWDA